jgi:hypothetical protein
LRGVLFGKEPHRFQFNNQFLFDHQVGKEVAKQRPILIEDSQRVLLSKPKACPLNPIRQCVLVDLLGMPVPQEPVRREGGFPDPIT